MKKIIKFLVLCLSCVLLFSLFGCNNNGGGDSGSGGSQGPYDGSARLEAIRIAKLNGEEVYPCSVTGYEANYSASVVSATETEMEITVSYYHKELTMKVVGTVTWSNQSKSFSYDDAYIIGGTTQLTAFTMTGLSVLDCFGVVIRNGVSDIGFAIQNYDASLVTFSVDPATSFVRDLTQDFHTVIKKSLDNCINELLYENEIR